MKEIFENLDKFKQLSDSNHTDSEIMLHRLKNHVQSHPEDSDEIFKFIVDDKDLFYKLTHFDDIIELSSIFSKQKESIISNFLQDGHFVECLCGGSEDYIERIMTHFAEFEELLVEKILTEKNLKTAIIPS